MDKVNIPTSPIKRIPPLVATENCLVLSDIHVPYHDKALIELAVECGREANVDNVILAGDFLSMDSLYDGGTVPSVMEEIKIGKKIIEAIDTYMNYVNKKVRFYWIMGNHEYRIVRETEKQIGIDALSSMLETHADITVSELAWMKIKGWGLVSHPGNYSKIPLSVPQELSEKYKTNIITAHGHHAGRTFSKSGYTVIEGGVCCDNTKALYTQRLQKRMPAWAKGFVITKRPANGKTYATLFTPEQPCLEIAKALV